MTFTHLTPKEIPKINQKTVNGKRHYETPSGEFISITSLLSSLTPDAILEWRKSVGDDVADYVMRTAANRGSKVHKMIESYLKNERQNDPVREFGVLPAGLFSIMTPGLDRIDRIQALEQAVYSTRLGVAGRTDCIADFDGLTSTIDFKTSTKKREINENYLLQATFYSLGWEELTGEKIKQIVIITGTEDGYLDVHQDDPLNYVEKLEKAIADYRATIK